MLLILLFLTSNIKEVNTKMFLYHTCGYKKLCSVQVIFLFLVFLNLFRNILHLISEKNAWNTTKQYKKIMLV